MLSNVYLLSYVPLVYAMQNYLQEGLDYHHAEKEHVMLVRWIAGGEDTIPANASHRVGIGAFIMDSERRVKTLLLPPQ